MIHLDTSFLIDAFSGPDVRATLRPPLERGDRIAISTLVLYEWMRRPRTVAETQLLDSLLPADERIAFGVDEAQLAARLYRQVKRARTREVDIAIAACAIEHGAALWTLNPKDFEDIPGLTLYRP